MCCRKSGNSDKGFTTLIKYKYLCIIACINCPKIAKVITHKFQCVYDV